MKLLQTTFLIQILLAMISCGPRSRSVDQPSRTPRNVRRITRLEEPRGEITITLGEEIPVTLAAPDTAEIDSIQVILGGALKETIRDPAGAVLAKPVKFTLQTGTEHTGRTGLRLKVFLRGGTSENQSLQVTFLSDIVPVDYGFRVVREFPHDVEAYTQGLLYEDGWLYEGTGNYGSSSIRRVKLETGEVNKIRDLDQSLFGEGITIFNNRIYQLTYKSQVGFIYDKYSFEEIQKVYYQNKEGWGLTHNDTELIMSDGTNIIYFLDPEMFTVNRQLEVYHDKGPVQSLNELEYINGKIWANRYYTDEIVIIDPESGKVEGRINLKGLLSTRDRKASTDVLNGIAWDRQGDRIFVTGKYWPKLFEILTVAPSRR